MGVEKHIACPSWVSSRPVPLRAQGLQQCVFQPRCGVALLFIEASGIHSTALLYRQALQVQIGYHHVSALGTA